MAQPSDVIIQGGTFYSAQGDINIININEDPGFGLHALSLAVSHGAIHDSAERYPPPKCHPDTRKAVRQIILDWIHDNSALPFFWLYGPVGAGKTAILQAIAEFLANSSEWNEYLGGSFFFSRGKHGRDQGHFLFLTIAYQLALKVPELRQHINHITEANPTLHTKSIATQLQTLIVDPLRSLSLPRRSYLVIIDGLDECQDKGTQQDILRLLGESITDRKLPLRVLIGSRPESHIRATFDLKVLYPITQRVGLDGTFSPGRDIEVFLRDGFAEIYAKHTVILSHAKRSWPAEGVIDLLVQRSSGQFIYAVTVLKFVGADFCHPAKQLELVLMPGSTVFSDLDQLYTQILSVYPRTTNIVQVLGVIVAFGGLPPEVIEDILGMEDGEGKLMLRGLSSLTAFVGDENEEYYTWVRGSNDVGSVYFIHTSFRDYLVDPSRSGPFYVNEQEYANWATARSFALVTYSIRRSWQIPTTTWLLQRKTWDYFTLFLPTCFDRSPKLVRDAIMKDIDKLVQEFWKFLNVGVVGKKFTEIHCLMQILKALKFRSNYVPVPRNELDARLRTVHGYQMMFDQSLISMFSKSRDMTDLLRLPGIVVQKGLTMQGMADLYDVEVALLERLSKYIEPFYKVPSYLYSRYVLERCLTGFLRDQSRSHRYYCDPTTHHVFICRRFLSLAVGSKLSDLQSRDIAEYFRYHLYEHLCAATAIFYSRDNIPDDHPALEILDDLDRITYYHLDESSSFSISLTDFEPVWKWTIDLTLKLKMLIIHDVSLIERLRHLIDRMRARRELGHGKIYRVGRV